MKNPLTVPKNVVLAVRCKLMVSLFSCIVIGFAKRHSGDGSAKSPKCKALQLGSFCDAIKPQADTPPTLLLVLLAFPRRRLPEELGQDEGDNAQACANQEGQSVVEHPEIPAQGGKKDGGDVIDGETHR